MPPVFVYGQHWNLFPEIEGQVNVINCVRSTFSQDCPVCAAIGREVDEGRSAYKDFTGMGGQAAQTKGMFYAVLLDITPVTPDVEIDNLERPAVKLVQVPYSVVNWIKERWADTDLGRDPLYNVDSGCKVRITRKKEKGRTSYAIALLQPYPIESEFLDVATWPKVAAHLPQEDVTVVTRKLMANLLDLPDWLANYLQTTNAAKSASRPKYDDSDPYE
jgi:hypothetical protein